MLCAFKLRIYAGQQQHCGAYNNATYGPLRTAHSIRKRTIGKRLKILYCYVNLTGVVLPIDRQLTGNHILYNRQDIEQLLRYNNRGDRLRVYWPGFVHGRAQGRGCFIPREIDAVRDPRANIGGMTPLHATPRRPLYTLLGRGLMRSFLPAKLK